MKTDSGIFDGTQTVIGHGAQADVYSYHGYAYKVYRPDYNPEWIKFEKAQQSVVNETGLCNVRYYDTDDLYTVKMDLIDGETLEKKMREGFAGGFDAFATGFVEDHEDGDAIGIFNRYEIGKDWWVSDTWSVGVAFAYKNLFVIDDDDGYYEHNKSSRHTISLLFRLTRG